MLYTIQMLIVLTICAALVTESNSFILLPERSSPPARNGAVPSLVKRLGFFRCYGWGPSCMHIDSVGGTGGGGGSSSNSVATSDKFEPFFTFTSGGSWAPTGKRAILPSSAFSQKQATPNNQRTLLHPTKEKIFLQILSHLNPWLQHLIQLEDEIKPKKLMKDLLVTCDAGNRGMRPIQENPGLPDNRNNYLATSEDVPSHQSEPTNINKGSNLFLSQTLRALQRR